jgi:DNA helicase-2/ATP-dependent DNA helicase PcrA
MGISAVPGSGKTHTLSALAAQLIRAGSLQDEQEVLIVTLVNSAVDNFTARIKDFLGLSLPFGYRVRTLHGLANDIVREKPGSVGLQEDFNILDEHDGYTLCRQSAVAWLQLHPSDLNGFLLPDLEEGRRQWIQRQQLPELITSIAQDFIRAAKDLRLSPDRLQKRLDSAPGPLPLAEMGLTVFREYQRALEYRAAVDFDDLIRLALELLENDPDYLDRLRYRWPFILEDEAQDSSRLQEQILRLLAGPQGNWVRVGDPNQAIFESFTTASPQHLIDFIHSPGVRYETLPESGRSQPRILALANALIEWVNAEHPEMQARDALTPPLIQPTVPGDPQPNPPDDPGGIQIITRKYTPDEELEAVTRSLARWLPEHPSSTVAVLVPRNARGIELIEALHKRRIDCLELLTNSSSTRIASGRLGDVIGCLADPGSGVRLSKAFLAWRQERGVDEQADAQDQQAADLLRACDEVESFLNPHPGRDWLSVLRPEATGNLDANLAAMPVLAELEGFQKVLQRWQGTTLLPIDQMILNLSQDLYTTPSDLALAYKLALELRKQADAHLDWRLPELNAELGRISRNERRFLGFSQEEAGFDPRAHPGKVVVTTMHKAKGLEWDRVYLMSVNSYDFPSLQPNDRYQAEKWYLRDQLSLEAETLAQLAAAGASDEYHFYQEGDATRAARLEYVRERLRLLYVGITRARQQLVLTWNSGPKGEQTPALPLVALQGWLEQSA